MLKLTDPKLSFLLALFGEIGSQTDGLGKVLQKSEISTDTKIKNMEKSEHVSTEGSIPRQIAVYY